MDTSACQNTGQTCAICLLELDDPRGSVAGHTVVRTVCQPVPHLFHLECTSGWFDAQPGASKHCAVCRQAPLPLLHHRGITVADQPPYCQPVALYACLTGDAVMLRQQLLDQPAIAQRRYQCPISQKPVTLLAIAARAGHSDCLQVLIDHGARDLNNALCTAARHGHRDCLKVLVEQPARSALTLYHGGHGMQCQATKIRTGADNLNEALHTAAINGHSGCLSYLLTQGADQIDIALWRASEGGSRRCLEILLANGAKQVKVAFCIAVMNNHSHCWQLLVDAITDLPQVDLDLVPSLR